MKNLFKRSPKDPRPQRERVQEIVDEAIEAGVIKDGYPIHAGSALFFDAEKDVPKPRWRLHFLAHNSDEMSQDAVAPRLVGLYMAHGSRCPDNVKREMKRSWE